MTTATRTQPTAEQQNQRQQREQRDERLTKIRQTRRAWDCIIAAHYHYTRDPKLGVPVGRQDVQHANGDGQAYRGQDEPG